MQNLVIISDIFGQTAALKSLADEIATKVTIIDPYQGEIMNFQNEQQAYDYFIANLGLSAYVDIITQQLSALTSTSSLLGFSMGSSAIWQYISNKPNGHIAQAIGFYGSQIRHYLSCTPKTPVTLIMPKAEPHFSVQELAQQLSVFKRVKIEHANYQHGFMNSHSHNFDNDGYRLYLNRIKELLNSTSP